MSMKILNAAVAAASAESELAWPCHLGRTKRTAAHTAAPTAANKKSMRMIRLVIDSRTLTSHPIIEINGPS